MLAPIAASATAVAFPIPEVPPVMRTVLPPIPPFCSFKTSPALGNLRPPRVYTVSSAALRERSHALPRLRYTPVFSALPQDLPSLDTSMREILRILRALQRLPVAASLFSLPAHDAPEAGTGYVACGDDHTV